MRKKGSKSRLPEQVRFAVVQTIAENRHCDLASIMMKARINQIMAKKVLMNLIAAGLVVSLSPREAGIRDDRVHAVYALCGKPIIIEPAAITCP